MTLQLTSLLLGALGIVGAIFALYSVYYIVVALTGLARGKAAPHAASATRFAVLVAARNEQAVIGRLVDSLHAQQYPRELYDVIVAPNNCTDDTQGEALRHGARIFNPTGVIRSKGDVMAQLVDWVLKQNRYDAICVFDADNLVHPDFLQQMNNTRQAGARVAQGFRDSKNPTDSAISTCYSVCYWMVNRFYNAGREKLGLSALVNGCGFMVDTRLLDELGGWNTHTMTEDYEFSAQCALAGHRVYYAKSAIFYDEQPLTFRQSWKQRRRWSTGSVQGMEAYLPSLLRGALQNRSFVCLDLALTYMQPLVQVLSLAVGIVTLPLFLYQLHLLYPVLSVAIVLLAAAGIALAAYLAAMTLAALIIGDNRRQALGQCGNGILFFALFMLSWIPIGVLSIFKRQTTWDAIPHTRAVALGELHAPTQKAA